MPKTKPTDLNMPLVTPAPAPKLSLSLRPGMKLREASIEYRLLLYLVSLEQRRIDTADFTTIASDMAEAVHALVLAANALVAAKAIEVKDFKLPVFTFAITGGKNKKTKWNSEACCYRSFMEAEKRHAERRALGVSAGESGTPSLPPIDPKLRAKLMPEAKPLAQKLMALDKEHLIWQIAGCVGRIGKPKVEALIAQVAAQKAEPHVGAIRSFFNLYVAERDLMLKPEQKVQP